MTTVSVKEFEECWVLTGQRREGVWLLRRRRYSTGDSTRVAFDASWALSREESHGDVMGFLHTHPVSGPAPSRRDLRTMRAWVGSLGKPLLCLINSRRGIGGYVSDGRTRYDVGRIVPIGRDVWVVVEEEVRKNHGGQVPSRGGLSRRCCDGEAL